LPAGKRNFWPGALLQKKLSAKPKAPASAGFAVSRKLKSEKIQMANRPFFSANRRTDWFPLHTQRNTLQRRAFYNHRSRRTEMTNTINRPTKATIDLSAINHNIQILKKRAAGAKVMAVVKADAYGHGAVEIARQSLGNGAEMLAVATPDEAIHL